MIQQMKTFKSGDLPTALNLLKVSEVVHCEFQNISFFEFALSDLRGANIVQYKLMKKNTHIISYVDALKYTYAGAVVAF